MEMIEGGFLSRPRPCSAWERLSEFNENVYCQVSQYTIFKQIPTSVEPNSASALVEFKNSCFNRVIVAVSKVSRPRTLLLLLWSTLPLKNNCDFAISVNTHVVLLKSLDKTLLTKTDNGGITIGLCTKWSC